MRRRVVVVSLAAALGGMLACPARALINPQVQPRHLFDLYSNALACRVAAVDSGSMTITLAVAEVAKGGFAPKKVTMRAGGKDLLQAVLSVEADQLIVAYVGRTAPASKRNDIIYYVGGGKWYNARMASGEAPDKWELLSDADEGKDPRSAEIMFGVFNGSVENLWAMTRDLADGRAYFPAKPFTRFSARKIDKLDRAVNGVALFDVNGDGRLDIVACSEGGNRVYIQSDKGAFEDRTEACGLARTVGKSCSLADADADGATDLLLDGVLYLQKDNRWVRTGLVPEQPSVVSAAFVEIDGDGYPDVVVSRAGGGLAVYGNAFTRKTGSTAPFVDLTAKLGLDRKDNGAGGTGYFEPGDWDGDGRTDLLYLTGPGYLLLGGDNGFRSSRIASEDDQPKFGAAAMAPSVHPDRNCAFIAMGDGKMLLESAKGGFADITRFGNEIQDDIADMLMPVAEDLNADGTIDIYAASSASGSPSFYCMNRGYGSFMLSEKYNPGKVIPPEVYNRPALGLAAGDATGDGANDLLVAGADGTLWLLVNETLTGRKAQADASTPSDERKRIQARIVTVRLARRTGVAGCKLALSDDRGRLVASRQIGGNVGVGCCGPHQVAFAVREPGRHKLDVLFSDGARTSLPVNLSADQPRHQVVVVPDASGGP